MRTSKGGGADRWQWTGTARGYSLMTVKVKTGLHMAMCNRWADADCDDSKMSNLCDSTER